MSYALMDNASLTAVQRVMGKIVVTNRDTINGDLIALENIIQAILFYDRLICIDNYKQEHTQNRKEFFNFVEFISPDELDFSTIEEKAKQEANSIKPEIKGGEFSDEDFRQFLELLKMNMICTWDMRSSVYYLTMKMLGEPNTDEYQKYTNISASIFSELSDVTQTYGVWSKDVILIGSDGHHYTQEEMARNAQKGNRGNGGTTKQLDMFIASLNWLSYKSIYYSIAAKYLRADTFLHPIRHAYQIHWMKKTGAYGHDFTSKLVESLSNNVSASISKIIDNGRNEAISLELPIFSAWLTSQTGDVSKVIQEALYLRKSSEFVEIRGMLSEIRLAYDEQGISHANKLIEKWKSQINKASMFIMKKYGLPTKQGIPTSHLIKVYNSIAALKSLPQFPDLNFRIPLPKFVQSNRTTAFSNMYKDITRELITIERLGGLRDQMAEKFKIDDSHYLAPKTESPRFRKFSSEWKIPM